MSKKVLAATVLAVISVPVLFLTAKQAGVGGASPIFLVILGWSILVATWVGGSAGSAASYWFLYQRRRRPVDDWYDKHYGPGA